MSKPGTRRAPNLVMASVRVRVRVSVRPHAFSAQLITQPDQHILVTSVRCRNEDEAAGHVVIIRKSEQPKEASTSVALRTFACHSSLRPHLYKKDS